MMDEEPAMLHRINAVSGWLELGCPGEALSEFTSLPSTLRERPELLELLWVIEARLERWKDALATAERLLAVLPENAASWLHRAYALRRAENGGLQKAWEALQPAFEKFPEEATIPYNLACYACQLGRVEEARAWLLKAERTEGIGGAKAIRAMALKDPDLAPLWPDLAKRKATTP